MADFEFYQVINGLNGEAEGPLHPGFADALKKAKPNDSIELLHLNIKSRETVMEPSDETATITEH